MLWATLHVPSAPRGQGTDNRVSFSTSPLKLGSPARPKPADPALLSLPVETAPKALAHSLRLPPSPVDRPGALRGAVCPSSRGLRQTILQFCGLQYSGTDPHIAHEHTGFSNRPATELGSRAPVCSCGTSASITREPLGSPNRTRPDGDGVWAP